MEKNETKILIADNLAYIRINIQKVLNEAGFVNIRHAENGEKALESFKDFNPHLVILDLSIPKFDVFELINIFKTINPGIQIVGLCETLTEEGFEKIKQKGLADYLYTPVKSEEVIKKINKIFKEKIIPAYKDKQAVDVTKQFDVSLNSEKSLQIIDLKGSLNSAQFDDLRNMIFSFQLYNYINVIIDMGNISKFNVDIKELIGLREIVKLEGGNFYLVVKDNELKKKIMKTELMDSIALDRAQAEILI